MEKISQLMDGELEERECERADQAAGARTPRSHRAGQTYHLIRDALRDEASAPWISRGGVHERLEAGADGHRSAHATRRAGRALYAAAGGGRRRRRSGRLAGVELQAAAIESAALRHRRRRLPSARASREPAAGQRAGERLSLAHQEFSPSTAMQGLASYVRTVSTKDPETRDEARGCPTAARAWSCLPALRGAALADTLEQTEALAWLQKIADAARELNYTGTFVYQHGDQVETSRITHFADASGEYEKLETLDGPRREVIRNNNEVLTFYPDTRVVRRERRARRARRFPALLPEQLSALTELLSAAQGRARSASPATTSQALMLEPRDDFRYGHKLWADITTGLLLKARMLNEKKPLGRAVRLHAAVDQQRRDTRSVRPASLPATGSRRTAQSGCAEARRYRLDGHEPAARLQEDHGDAAHEAGRAGAGDAPGVL